MKKNKPNQTIPNITMMGGGYTVPCQSQH